MWGCPAGAGLRWGGGDQSSNPLGNGGASSAAVVQLDEATRGHQGEGGLGSYTAATHSTAAGLQDAGSRPLQYGRLGGLEANGIESKTSSSGDAQPTVWTDLPHGQSQSLDPKDVAQIRHPPCRQASGEHKAGNEAGVEVQGLQVTQATPQAAQFSPNGQASAVQLRGLPHESSTRAGSATESQPMQLGGLPHEPNETKEQASAKQTSRSMTQQPTASAVPVGQVCLCHPFP